MKIFLEVMEKGDGVHRIGDFFRRQHSGEILPAVEIKLDIIGKPCLNLKEHPAELYAVIIKVIMLTFRKPGSDLQMFGFMVRFYSNGFAGFHCRESAEKAQGSPSFSGLALKYCRASSPLSICPEFK